MDHSTPARTKLALSLAAVTALIVGGALLFQPRTHQVSAATLEQTFGDAPSSCKQELRRHVSAIGTAITNVQLARLVRQDCGPVYVNGWTSTGGFVTVGIPREMVPAKPSDNEQ